MKCKDIFYFYPSFNWIVLRLWNWKLIKAGSDSPHPTLSKADVSLKNHVDVKELNGFYLKDNIFVDFYLLWDPTVYPMS